MSANNQSELTNKQTKLSLKTRKRKNVTIESVVKAERLPEKRFAIDLNEDVFDGDNSEIDPDDPPYITDAEDIESDSDEDKDNEIVRDFSINFTATASNKSSQIKTEKYGALDEETLNVPSGIKMEKETVSSFQDTIPSTG